MFDDDPVPARPRPSTETGVDDAAPPTDGGTSADDTNAKAAQTDSPPPRRRRWVRAAAIAVVVALALYYPIGMAFKHRIDDQLDFTVSEARAAAGGSAAVAMTAALVERQVDDAGWVPNDPFFFPGAALDNMPNFQLGMISALFRFAIELTDQIGRTRGSSQADSDLDAAAGALKYPGDVWVWDLEISFLPTASAEQYYRRAVKMLDRYNRRLAEGDAVFDRRADNLLGTLDRFAADLGSASAEIDSHIAEYSGGILDFKADDIFYNIKGRLYAYAMILAALETDFEQVIAERQLGPSWAQMSESLRHAVELDPLVVINGAPDGAVPSHLASQGFYLLRGRTQLREITNILLK